jgi:hypothetical protein
MRHRRVIGGAIRRKKLSTGGPTPLFAGPGYGTHDGSGTTEIANC